MKTISYDWSDCMTKEKAIEILFDNLKEKGISDFVEKIDYRQNGCNIYFSKNL